MGDGRWCCLTPPLPCPATWRAMAARSGTFAFFALSITRWFAATVSVSTEQVASATMNSSPKKERGRVAKIMGWQVGKQYPYKPSFPQCLLSWAALPSLSSSRKRRTCISLPNNAYLKDVLLAVWAKNWQLKKEQILCGLTSLIYKFRAWLHVTLTMWELCQLRILKS